MRTNIVAGNWKMNLNFEEADELINNIVEFLENETLENVGVIVCPPAVYLELATDQAQDNDLYVGAQNMSNHESGAYTGEISGRMLASMGVNYCIIGHSERRKYFNENHEMLAEKVNMALKNDISPIFCCGEVLPEREAGKHFEVVKKQLEESLFHLQPGDFSNVVIAYEPVWAIGTGVTASPEQAQEMHAFIRKLLVDKYGHDLADETTILYGGSCNAKNAKELFANPDVDGGLIGGASLKSDEFISIIQSF
ncbi:MAG TPA: triose-phosphate isomerase [Bacteroidales bacterium]|nr:triose-phosphate isomerase [Bacteroidales bacterium]HRX95982.1 triose-phosphate isomerase [Bacteroidales bacterium]